MCVCVCGLVLHTDTSLRSCLCTNMCTHNRFARVRVSVKYGYTHERIHTIHLLVYVCVCVECVLRFLAEEQLEEECASC